MSIYPSIPEHATKDWFEMFEPVDPREIYCTCKHIDGKLEECESCKLYHRSGQINAVVDVLQTLTLKKMIKTLAVITVEANCKVLTQSHIILFMIR
jgi:Zn-finger protein